MEARLRPISSVTMAGSVSIGGWRAAKQWPGGTLVRERPDEAVAFEDGLQRVPGQRIGSPSWSSRRARLVGEASLG